MLERVYLGNTVLDWLYAGGLALLTLAAALAIRSFFRSRDRTPETIESGQRFAAGKNLLGRLGHRTYFLFALAVSLEIGSNLLTISEQTVTWINRGFIVACILQVGVWGTVVAGFLLQRVFDPNRPSRDTERTTTGIIQLLANVAVWSVVLLLGLENLGVDVSAVIAGLGVGGIAIALATQTLLGDVIASVSLLFDEPFKPGDFVVVGQDMGTVQKVGVRTTRIKALSGELLVLSNTDLLKSRIQNFKVLEERRIVFHFGVTYDTPAATLRAIPEWVKAIVEGVEKTRFDRSHFAAFGESDLRFETVFFVLDPDYAVYMDVQQAINLGICEKLEAEGVSFAFPTRTLHHVGLPPMTVS